VVFANSNSPGLATQVSAAICNINLRLITIALLVEVKPAAYFTR
jgi:hypothetical protein